MFPPGNEKRQFYWKAANVFFFCPKHKSYTRPCIEFGFREYRGRVFPVEARALDDVLLLGWSVTCGRPEAETSVFLLHINKEEFINVLFANINVAILVWCSTKV